METHRFIDELKTWYIYMYRKAGRQAMIRLKSK